MNLQEHILTCMAEECLETAHRVTKALRFGLKEIQSGQPLTNLERINIELTDLMAVISLLNKYQTKKDKVMKFARYAREQGALND